MKTKIHLIYPVVKAVTRKLAAFAARFTACPFDRLIFSSSTEKEKTMHCLFSLTHRFAVMLLFTLCLATASGQTIDSYYASDYSVTNLGFPTNITAPTGALTFLAGDPNTLLVIEDASSPNTKIYRIGVVRDTNNHVTGFATSTATFFASAPLDDGGLAYGPDGVLFYTGYFDNILGQTKPGSTSPDKTISLTSFGITSSTGTLTFVPDYAPGEGRLKITSYDGGGLYDVELTPDGSGTFDITTVGGPVNVGGGPEGLVYVTPGSPLFPVSSLLVGKFDTGRFIAYEVDGLGDPILATGRIFLTGVDIAGATMDSVTGDILFTKFSGGNSVFLIRGFAAPPLIYGGDLSLTTQSQVDAFNYNQVRGSLYINGPSITNLSGLSELSTVGSSGGQSLVIAGNSSLTNLDGLSSLSSVFGDFYLVSNHSLSNVDGLSSLSSVRILDIGDNPSLINVDGLSSLSSVLALAIGDNPSLSNVDGLSSLSSVGVYVFVLNNSSLTNVDGLSSISSVPGQFGVFNNSLLSDCCGIQQLVNTPGAVGGGINIFGNQTGCESLPAVQNSTCFSCVAQVQPPINADGTSIFNARRGVVPVKFRLTCDGHPSCDLSPATIAVTRTAGGVIGEINESVYSSQADSGSNFRTLECQYHYNLNSRALGVGTYRVDILIDGRVVGSATFELR